MRRGRARAREREAAVRTYAAELMADESLSFNRLAEGVGVHTFPNLSTERNGVALHVWGVRFGERVEVVVDSEDQRVIYQVIRDGFVAWDDGRRTATDQMWEEYTS